MGLKILIIAIVIYFVWSILKWTIKFIGGIWGLKDQNIVAGVGLLIFISTIYVIYTYGEKGVLLFGTILVLVFFAVKQTFFVSNEKFEREDNANYFLIEEKFESGMILDPITMRPEQTVSEALAVHAQGLERIRSGERDNAPHARGDAAGYHARR